jgi:hypothetical protein
MLQELNQQQLERALRFLNSPLKADPPPELQQLSPVEWYLLNNLLENLLEEKKHHRLQ